MFQRVALQLLYGFCNLSQSCNRKLIISVCGGERRDGSQTLQISKGKRERGH